MYNFAVSPKLCVFFIVYCADWPRYKSLTSMRGQSRSEGRKILTPTFGAQVIE
jgi:hypothetical protein